ncbi:hypothetical protein GW17_00056994 [Ensete ventricosum]|nr:hypothetical protein GW17_00056994 [Ensete ventricosum]
MSVTLSNGSTRYGRWEPRGGRRLHKGLRRGSTDALSRLVQSNCFVVIQPARMTSLSHRGICAASLPSTPTGGVKVPYYGCTSGPERCCAEGENSEREANWTWKW